MVKVNHWILLAGIHNKPPPKNTAGNLDVDAAALSDTADVVNEFKLDIIQDEPQTPA